MDSAPLSFQDKPALSVKDISLLLKKTVETTFSDIRIQGEVSGLKRHSSGHLYFALKDHEAVLDAVCWRGSAETNNLKLEDGLEIIATGRLTTYPARSKYQMIVERFEPTGQGALLKLLEDRKKKLLEEGLFNLECKKKLPPFPQKIGVVTSPTGAVIRDILHRIQDRFPCHVIVWPVLVQGTGAAEQIAAAINGFNQLTCPPDLLIVARGGGSLEDLWAFNEEIVVRAAAHSKIPLISAVGHETDTTLIDYAADVRAPTPTAAAEMAVPLLADLWAYLQDRQRRQNQLIVHYTQQHQLKLESLKKGLPNLPQLIFEKTQRLDDWSDRLSISMKNLCDTLFLRLSSLRSHLKIPDGIIQLNQQQFHFLQERLDKTLPLFFNKYSENVTQLANRLDQASFQRVLERGFSWTSTLEGNTISSAKQIKVGELFQTHFHDGVISSIRVSKPLKSNKKYRQIDQETLF